ncbi:hypothetical protein F4782DRAFT_528623 [Xylaria castorea]|nr:hypothetical protein F4782DRAFT_528623 [Xylaria castorea]
MTLAVWAVTELYRAVERKSEVYRKMLGFSISHNHESFYFTLLDGEAKSAAYSFTKNVYGVWVPAHFEMICLAIDQLPSNLNFDVEPLPGTGLSQRLGSQYLSQSDADSIESMNI